jgi:pimeloyl-ACP methyl ester carboxylesterase
MLSVSGARDRILAAASGGARPAREAVIANAGHMPQFESPQELTALIGDFVRGAD